MPLETATSAQCKCSMGDAPGKFRAPTERVLVESKPGGSIIDNKPTNFDPPIGTFGKCKSMMNPLTASLTAAAFGKLTPGMCLPAFPIPWMPGSVTVSISGHPALTNNSILICVFGGVVKIEEAGQAEMSLMC